MPVALGLDLGTTTITALAVDTDTGQVTACATRANRADATTAQDRARARSEWDPFHIVVEALVCLDRLADHLGRSHQIVGLGVTGQQHGVLLVGRDGRPVSPLINWQDRRGEEPFPGGGGTYVEEARRRVGWWAAARTGCRLATGYMAVTLFWLARQGLLPEGVKACFLMDHITARLTDNTDPFTDPTCAASSGVFDLERGDWAFDLIDELELPRGLFPPVRPSGRYAGLSISDISVKLGLPEGLPVYGGIGDNQASFLGTVADRSNSVLVNVGTGGQVAVWSPRFAHDDFVETRPFPGEGYLLVSAGLSGGAAYAQLERFFRSVAMDLTGVSETGDIYTAMNRLAEGAPAGCDGLLCEPYFGGTRAEPWRRASWSNVSGNNFTPGHLARSLLEGMARTFAASRDRIVGLSCQSPKLLIGAGNGIRSNPLLARIIAGAFGMPMHTPAHREEAAYGAALLAAVQCGARVDLTDAGRLILLQPQ